MKGHKTGLIVFILGPLLALFGGTPAANACYMPANPSLVRDFSAFVADFDRWDASLGYQPLIAVSSAAPQEQSDVVLVLWWLWMMGYGRTPEAGSTGVFAQGLFTPPLSPEGPADSSNNGLTFSLPLPPIGGSSLPTPPIGIILPEGNGPQGGDSRPDIASLPEPSTLTLLGLGLAGMAGYGWRRRKT
jgi:hypothetical protein